MRGEGGLARIDARWNTAFEDIQPRLNAERGEGLGEVFGIPGEMGAARLDERRRPADQNDNRCAHIVSPAISHPGRRIPAT